MKINNNLYEYKSNNTFSKVKRAVAEYKLAHPCANLISLGIGDVSQPIPKPVVDAICTATDNLRTMENFPGYGSYYGMSSLKQTILNNEYKEFGFTENELYISDGAKSDAGNILELFDKNSLIGVPSTMYPIYQNSCIAMNRTVMPIPMDKDLKCLPPWKQDFDIIYLCSPNNPTGLAYTYIELEQWHKYCQEHNTIIIYDNVYESFIKDKNCPHSIYEVDGMKQYAIELRSFSKKASFTGMRCSYYIIPNEIAPDINYLWQERTLNRFNGASYLAQVGAQATYLPEAQEIIKNNVTYYQYNAYHLKTELQKLGFHIIGGDNAPFMLIKNINNMSSWDMFY